MSRTKTSNSGPIGLANYAPMTYDYYMVIKETQYFTDIIKELMTDESYAEFQMALVRRPELGQIIPGSGGLRKVRWKLSDKGKRGGVRVIYYWLTHDKQIYMLFAYQKAKQENLTQGQLKILRQVVEEELKNG